jgi:hypothetical protein
MLGDFLMTFYLWGLMQMYLQKVIKQIRNFFFLLLASWKSLTKRTGSGSWSLNQSPDPYQNVTNPEHWFVLLETELFPRKFSSHFWFFNLLYFRVLFYVGSESKSDTGTESKTKMHLGSSSAKEKSCGSCGSCSTTLLKGSALKRRT